MWLSRFPVSLLSLLSPSLCSKTTFPLSHVYFRLINVVLSCLLFISSLILSHRIRQEPGNWRAELSSNRWTHDFYWVRLLSIPFKTPLIVNHISKEMCVSIFIGIYILIYTIHIYKHTYKYFKKSGIFIMSITAKWEDNFSQRIIMRAK